MRLMSASIAGTAAIRHSFGVGGRAPHGSGAGALV